MCDKLTEKRAKSCQNQENERGRVSMIKATNAAARKFKEIADANGNPEELNLRFEIEPGG